MLFTIYSRARTLARIVLYILPISIFSLPQEDKISQGDVSITKAASEIWITQTSEKAIIDWKDFSLKEGEKAKFYQNKDFAILNRVVTDKISKIYGAIEAQGKFYLINQNGILIGPKGSINANEVILSTLELAKEDFLKGKNLKFTKSLDSKIQNFGSIKAFGSNIFIFSKNIENKSQIIAENGNINLLSASEILLFDETEDIIIKPNLDGKITNEGNIKAIEVKLAASNSNLDSFAINQKGLIEATGFYKKNGKIILSAPIGAISNSGSLSARNETLGGEIHLLGERVFVEDGSKIDVSQDNGGGKVLIGGDFQGKNPEILNAKKVFIAKDSKITSDAIESGDGGKVIVFSDETTQFYGKISAKGGVRDGDGGFVEVSSNNYLDFNGIVNCSALHGKNGELLLDPSDIEITTLAFSNPFFTNPYNPGSQEPNPCSLYVTDLTNLLNSGTSVTISTFNGDQGSGNISVLANVNWQGVASLTLQASNNLFLDNGISIGGSETLGNINLKMNTISFAGLNSIQSQGNLTFKTANKATTISIGSNQNTLAIDNSIIDSLADGFSSITIGELSQTGRIDISKTTFKDPIKIIASDIHVLDSLDTTGSISLQSDTIDIQAEIGMGGNTTALSLLPINTSTNIGLLGASSAYQVSSSQMGQLSNNLTTLNIGSLVNGFNDVTIGVAGSFFFNDFDVNIFSNTIALNAALTMQANKNINCFIGKKLDNTGNFTFNNSVNLSGNGSFSISGKENNIDTIIGLDSGSHNWIVNNLYSGILDNATFSQITKITARNGNDTFTITSGKVDTINLGDGSNVFTINAGEVTNVSGNATFNLNSGIITNLIGGANSNDMFNVAGTALTNGLDGNGGVNTLKMIGGTNIWTIKNGLNNGNIQTSLSPTFDFQNIQKLISGPVSDVFAFEDGSVSSITLTPNSFPTLDYQNFDSAVLVNFQSGEASGVISKIINPKNIKNVIGHSSTLGTLLGLNGGETTWSFNNTNEGSISSTTGLLANFSNINTIVGGTSQETFFMGLDSQIETLTLSLGTNILDYQNRGSPIGVNFQAKTASGIGKIENIKNLTQIRGDKKSFGYIVGPDTFTTSWKISGVNSGSIANSNLNIFTNFYDIAILTAGVGNDNFNVRDSATIKDINLTAGNNSFSIAKDAHVTNLRGGGIDHYNLMGGSITNLIGSAYGDTFILKGTKIETLLDGGGGDNKLEITKGPTLWNITATDQGNITSSTSGSFAFNNIQNLTGGSFADTFVLSNGALISGEIDAKSTSNINVLDYKDSLENINVNLDTNAASNILKGIKNIQKIIGSQGINTLLGKTNENNIFEFPKNPLNTSSVIGNTGNNTLIKTNGDNVWNITSPNAGNINNDLDFTQITNLKGSIGNDSFIISHNSGQILTIDGGESGNNSISGPNERARYEILADNAGKIIINQSLSHITFSNIKKLIGGNSVDNFAFMGPYKLDGIDGMAIDGGNLAENSIISENSEITIWHLCLSEDNSGNINPSASGPTNFKSIQNIQGGLNIDNFIFDGTYRLTGSAGISAKGGVSNIYGPSTGSYWRITNKDIGDMTYLGKTTKFTKPDNGILNLIGSDLAGDVFDFAYRGVITGKIDGNSLNNEIRTNSILSGSVILNINGEEGLILKGFQNIDKITGGNANEVLVGRNYVTNTWNILSENDNQGTLINEVDNIKFSQINSIKGGNFDDTFIIEGPYRMSGDNIGSSIDGSGGNNTLLALTTVDNTWKITDINAGEILPLNGSGMTKFINIQNITGGDQKDTFVFLDQKGITGTLIGGSSKNPDMEGNVLDYSAYTSVASMNFEFGLSTNIGGGVKWFSVFISPSAYIAMPATSQAASRNIAFEKALNSEVLISYHLKRFTEFNQFSIRNRFFFIKTEVLKDYDKFLPQRYNNLFKEIE